MDEKITLVDLKEIDPPGEMARDFIDPDKVRELGENIRAVGLLEPIIIRPRNGRFEVVVGHRRTLAHQMIGETKIKAIIRELTDEEVEVIRTVENDQRVDLNPIERAKRYKRLKEKFGMSIVQIAQKMSRHRNTINNYLELLETPEEFQEALARGLISMEVGRTLNKIEDPKFRSFYFESAVRNGVTLEVAEQWVTDWRKTRVPYAQGGDGGEGVDLSGQPTTPIYATCVCCLGAVETGKVRYIGVCPNCEKEIRGAMKPEGSK